MAARAAPRPAGWQRGPSGPSPAAPSAPPNTSHPVPRPAPRSSYRQPPPQRSSRNSPLPPSIPPPPPSLASPPAPAPSSPPTPSLTSAEHAIQIRGRARHRAPSGSPNGRSSSESPSKARHSALCARPRFVLSVACCLVTFSLLFLSSAYTHRDELWKQIAAPSGHQSSHVFRLSGLSPKDTDAATPDQPDTPPILADDVGVPIVPEADNSDDAADTSKVKPSPTPTPGKKTPTKPPKLTPNVDDKAKTDPKTKTPVTVHSITAKSIATPTAAAAAADAAKAAADAEEAREAKASKPLSYKPNALMKSSIFPKTKEGYPLFARPSTPLYSSFYCIGGRGRSGTQGDRSCRWQNLCYRPSTEQWLFYQDPATNGTLPIILDHGHMVSEFPKEGFVNLRSMGNPQDAEYWSPLQVYDEIPADAMVKPKHEGRADVYLLYRSHYPSNIGHVLGDDFFPLFNLQLSFNMLSNDNTLIMSKSCDRIFLPSAPGKAAACAKFMSMLTPGMTDRPYLAATDADFAEALGVQGDLLCFENVLTGNGPWGFQQSLGKAPSWWQYHAFYLSNMGLSPNHTPSKHRITVSIKDGKRSIYNNQEMVEHLRKAFPNHEVDAIELYKLGGWKKELQYLLDTTVLITPCGGVSMSAMFLPHGSAMVVVDYWDVNKANSVGMEERLWSNLGYVRPFHYPFTEDEVVLAEEEGGKKLSRKVRQDMRDWGRVKVDMARMEQIVRAAIAHVDSFMVMGTP